MFESISAKAFFPTLVWVHEVEAARAQRLNTQLSADLDRMTAPRPQLRTGQTWQTDQNMHELPEFAELTAVINAASKGVLDKFEVDCEDFAITGCWANINPPGSPHNPHTHPNNLLSGVYYVQAPEGADSICFHEPRPQVDIISPRYKRTNTYNAMIATQPIKPGLLVIFPSWIVHSVVANRSKGLRISVAFNIMPTNYIEDMSRPKWTGIPLKSQS